MPNTTELNDLHEAQTVGRSRTLGELLPDRVRELLKKAAVDRAVAYGVMASMWQFGAAPITLLMIARGLSAEAQGFYYTFASLLGLQTYVELGLSTVILNSASHYYAHLVLDNDGLHGDDGAKAGLAGLFGFAIRWYGVASLIFFAAVGIAGHLLLTREGGGIAWHSAWWTLMALTSVALWLLPLKALLEGCNQVKNVQRFRLSQVVLRSLGIWLALAFGWNLWAAVIAAAVALGRDLYLILVQYRRFFLALVRARPQPVKWRASIWPMQWRLAVAGMVSYFLFQTFTPVIFAYHGAVEAGRVGMTMSLVSATQGIAAVWLQPKVPGFGILIARGDFVALNREWRRVTRACVAVAAALACAAWLVVSGIDELQIPLASRMLPPLQTALFLCGAVCMTFEYCLTAYLRAHVREPTLVANVMTSLAMGGLGWLLGRYYGSLGVAATYVLVVGVISVPWRYAIWRRCRREWHAPPALV